MRLGNFKPFGATDWIPLRELTLVLGKNSSGKTSFLQPLLLLKQTLDERISESGIELNGDLIELGSYQQVVHNHAVERPVTIALRGTGIWSPAPPISSHSFRYMGEENEFEYELDFAWDAMLERIDVTHLRQASRTNDISIGREQTPGSAEATITGTISGRTVHVSALKSDNIVNPTARIPVPDGLDPLTLSSTRHPTEVESLGRDLARYWTELLRSIDYIPPVREAARRWYTDTTSRQTPDYSGRYAASEMRRLARRRPDALDFIAQWLKRFDIADEVTADRLAEGLISLRLRDAVTSVRSSVADFGFGTSQILPLLLYAATSRGRRRVLIAQQPEVHLHPRAQAELADLLIYLTDPRRQVIVETHSEHLVRRLQRRIASGDISRDQIAILFFEKREDGTHVHELGLSETGQFEGDLPPGFLDTGYMEASEFSKELQARMIE